MNRFSAIAIQRDYRRDEGRWIGTIHSGDHPPEEFGSKLWWHLQDNFNSLDRFSQMLLGRSTWQEYIDDGLCPFCGKFDVGSPVNIEGNILMRHKNGEVAPDKDSQFHRHITDGPKVYPNCGYNMGLWADWIYLIHPKDYTLEVLRAVITDGTHLVSIPGLLSIPQNNFKYYSLAFYSMFKDEPDWKALERHADGILGYYYNRYENRFSRVVKN